MNPNNSSARQIENLKKVTLAVRAGSEPGKEDIPISSTEMEFIFGIGSQGLTPFEFELADKKPGDTVSLAMAPDQLCRAFQHIPLPSIETSEKHDTVHLTFSVKKVSTAESREIVKAMAQLTECGDDCDCCGHMGH